MTSLGTLVSFETASALIDQAIKPISRTEKVSLDTALGRVLAADIIATHVIPPFNRAAMDGYAVLAADIASVAPYRTLTIVEEIYAGSVPQKKLSPGQTALISTGARLPEGADTVVMVEDTQRNGTLVNVLKYWEKGSSITPKGSDINEGELVLKTGTVLEPAGIGVLASQGLSEVEVFAKPTIAILPTGEEVSEVGGELKSSGIYDINSHTLAAVVRQHGGEPRILPIARDDMDHLKASLEEALEADMVITSGGSSVGEKDLMGVLLGKLGEVKFHGVRLKPGKPSAFAIVKGKPVLGMPGYPTSCLMNAYLLLAPALRKMARLSKKADSTVEITLGENVRGAPDRVMIVPLRIEGDKAYSAFKGSSAITSMALAQGYITVPPDGELTKGSRVHATLF
jgi:molybdopterin molybdotransferase